jgi:LemA protein
MRTGTIKLDLTVLASSVFLDAPCDLAMASSFIVPGAALFLVFIALVIPAFFILMWFGGAYNRLVALRNAYKGAYARIDIELKRRYDLILDLVETAKGYIHNDRGTLEAVGAARNAASAANGRAAHSPGDIAVMRELSGAESALAATLARMFAGAATCPDVKADAKMVSLTQELSAAAAKAAVAGQDYNDAVMRYNTLRTAFPTSLIAGPLSFGPAELFGVNGLVQAGINEPPMGQNGP